MGKLDILNRNEFVDQLVMLVENISANKSSTSFALDGVWGCGKTFVLDMFQEKLEQIQNEETSDDKYFVIRYDSWKFDYYEEPLVAIVSSMISIIEQRTMFIDGKNRLELLGMLKAVAVTLLSIGETALKEKTGIDVNKVCETVINGKKDVAAEYEKQHTYDTYFSLNKVIEKLVELLQNIAEEYTIVFLVDELDRCLPEYTVKVLERLHHLTEGTQNIITIISMDKKQLMSSVKSIFGFNNPEKYLEKFIEFDIKLDNGKISKSICDKYADYISLFDKNIFKFDDPVDECIREIFKGIDVRTQEHLINKSMLAHQLLYNSKKDYSFMCMELLLTVMICYYNDDTCFRNTSINLKSFDKVFVSEKGPVPNFSDFFKNKFEKIEFEETHRYDGVANLYTLPDKAELYGSILYTWYWLHERNILAVIDRKTFDAYEPISKNHEELKKFAETIKMMS